jgi:hypothetical protein
MAHWGSQCSTTRKARAPAVGEVQKRVSQGQGERPGYPRPQAASGGLTTLCRKSLPPSLELWRCLRVCGLWRGFGRPLAAGRPPARGGAGAREGRGEPAKPRKPAKGTYLTLSGDALLCHLPLTPVPSATLWTLARSCSQTTGQPVQRRAAMLGERGLSGCSTYRWHSRLGHGRPESLE